MLQLSAVETQRLNGHQVSGDQPESKERCMLRNTPSVQEEQDTVSGVSADNRPLCVSSPDPKPRLLNQALSVLFLY